MGRKSRKTTNADNAWTVDDVVSRAEEAVGMRIAPDGKHAVWIKRVPDKEKNEMIGHLMRSSLTDVADVQLTRGQYFRRASHNGRRTASASHFFSARPLPKGTKNKRDDDEKDDDKTQIWLINPFGGEPWPLTNSPRDVRNLCLEG